MHRHMGGMGALSLAALMSLSCGASGELALSANDGKAVLIDGVNAVPANPPADSVTVIDLSATPPKVIADIPAPTSVIGPPSSVAIARDESFALVAEASKIDPADPEKTVPDDKLTVIDLKASPPKVAAQLQAGAGAAGVSINRAGNLALVANRSEGTVSVFTIAGKTVAPAGKIPVGEANSGPSHVVIAADGKTALLTRDNDHKISVLAIDGTKVTYTKRDLNAGLRPYGMDICPPGNIAVVANIGIGQGDHDTISVIDLTLQPPRVTETLTVGQTPEGIKCSPDGSWVGVVVMNGSNKPANSPFYAANGKLVIYQVNGKQLQKFGEAPIGNWSQGVVFSGGYVLVQNMVQKNIQVFRLDRSGLIDTGQRIPLKAGPAGIRTAEK